MRAPLGTVSLRSVLVRLATPIHTGKVEFELLITGLAVILLMSGNVWHIVRMLITWGHEGGHALAAVSLGGKLTGIRLYHTTAGTTFLSMGKGHPVKSALVSFAGYPAPEFLGLVFGLAISTGYLYDAILLISGASLATLTMMRNVVGFLSTLVIAAGFICLLIFLPPAYAIWPVLIIWGTFTVGALRSTLEAIQRRARGMLKPNDLSGDVYGVSQRLGIPPFLVEAAWLVLNASCAGFSIWLVTHPI